MSSPEEEQDLGCPEDDDDDVIDLIFELKDDR